MSEGFSSNSFTCHMSVILLPSSTAVSSSAPCLVDTGLSVGKVHQQGSGDPHVGESPWQLPRQIRPIVFQVRTIPGAESFPVSDFPVPESSPL